MIFEDHGVVNRGGGVGGVEGASVPNEAVANGDGVEGVLCFVNGEVEGYKAVATEIGVVMRFDVMVGLGVNVTVEGVGFAFADAVNGVDGVVRTGVETYGGGAVTAVHKLDFYLTHIEFIFIEVVLVRDEFEGGFVDRVSFGVADTGGVGKEVVLIRNVRVVSVPGDVNRVVGVNLVVNGVVFIAFPAFDLLNWVLFDTCCEGGFFSLAVVEYTNVAWVDADGVFRDGNHVVVGRVVGDIGGVGKGVVVVASDGDVNVVHGVDTDGYVGVEFVVETVGKDVFTDRHLKIIVKFVDAWFFHVERNGVEEFCIVGVGATEVSSNRVCVRVAVVLVLGAADRDVNGIGNFHPGEVNVGGALRGETPSAFNDGGGAWVPVVVLGGSNGVFVNNKGCRSVRSDPE